jgi:hypothetical protein
VPTVEVTPPAPPDPPTLIWIDAPGVTGVVATTSPPWPPAPPTSVVKVPPTPPWAPDTSKVTSQTPAGTVHVDGPTVENVTTVGVVAAPLGTAATKLLAAANTAAPPVPNSAVARLFVLVDERPRARTMQPPCRFGNPFYGNRLLLFDRGCRSARPCMSVFS